MGSMTPLRTSPWNQAKPYLGICVGMQLMATRGLEHGVHDGFGWIPGDIAPIKPSDPSLKIPQMGWNTLARNRRFAPGSETGWRARMCTLFTPTRLKPRKPITN